MINIISSFFSLGPLILLLMIIGLFLVMILSMSWGRKIALTRIAKDQASAKIGIGEIESAIFALVGLLIAFTFYGASQRFDIRRQMIVNEANTIGTAYLRVDVLPEAAQLKMRELFKQYTTARTNVSLKLPDISAAKKQITISNELQTKIWNLAIESSKTAPNPMIFVILLPALNSMFDMAASHNFAMITHPPLAIFITLIILMLISSYYVGYSLAGGKYTNWIHGVSYAVIMVGIFYVIIDFEFPRLGFIHLKDFDQPMIDLIEKIGKQ